MTRLCVLLLLISIAAHAGRSPSTELLDGVAAVVDYVALTFSELRIEQQIAKRCGKKLELKDIRQYAVEQMVLMQEAKNSMSVFVTEAEVEEKISAFKKKFSKDGYEQFLQQCKASVDMLRNHFRRGLYVKKYLNKYPEPKPSDWLAELQKHHNVKLFPLKG